MHEGCESVYRHTSVGRQNAFEHLIRIFRFLVIHFRCGKRQDTISDKCGTQHTIDTTQ